MDGDAQFGQVDVGFQDKAINFSFDQGEGLLSDGLRDFRLRDMADRRDRLSDGAYRAEHEFVGTGRFASEARTGQVDLGDERFVAGKADPVGLKRVGFDEVAARVQVTSMDLYDPVRMLKVAQIAARPTVTESGQAGPVGAVSDQHLPRKCLYEPHKKSIS